MKPTFLPTLPDTFLVSPVINDASSLVQKWQESVRQTTRQWLRGGGEITLWLEDFRHLRTDMIDKVWRSIVPAHWRNQTRYILLGSAARGEDVLTSDLDHALLLLPSYEEPLNVEELRPYLYHFIQTMAGLGFPPCQGFVMSTNPRWVGTASQWYDRIQSYLKLPHWEHVRYLFMMIDSMPLLTADEECKGDGGLQSWEQVRAKVADELSKSAYLCWEMSHLGIHGTVASVQASSPLSFRTKTFSVKAGLLNPIIHSLRLLSVAEGISDISTLARLKSLEDHRVIDRGLAKNLRTCLEFGWKQRILQSMDRTSSAETEDEILVHKLDRADQEILRDHLQTAKTLERMVHRRFRKPRLGACRG